MDGDEEIREERYEIIVSGNGDTLWVNGDDGLCWARFSKRFGLDVHRNASMQQAERECLQRTHSRAGVEDWANFRDEVYGITAPSFQQTRFRLIDRLVVRCFACRRGF